MKTLVVYYSRSGTTQALAEQIAQGCGADLECIQESRQRRGVWGYLRSVVEAILQQEAAIRPSEYDPADYELVVLGTPVWAWNMASPVRSYVQRHQGLFRNLALFCTYGGAGESKVLSELQELCDQHALASLCVNSHDFHLDLCAPQLTRFLHALKNAGPAGPTEYSQGDSVATAAPL